MSKIEQRRRDILDRVSSGPSLSQRILKHTLEGEERLFGGASKKEQKSERRQQRQMEYHPMINCISDPQIVKWNDQDVDLRSISDRLMIFRDSITGRIIGYR